MSSGDEEIKLSFLLSGSCDVLPSSCIKLRSYLNLHLSNIADKHNLKLLRSFRNRNKTCPYCYTPWNVETSSFKLLPTKRCKKKNRNESSESDKPQSNDPRNTLVLKCKVCTKKSSFSLVKRKHVEEKVQEETVEVKKKKKKKDKSCGLVVDMVKPLENEKPEVLFVKKKKRCEDSDLAISENTDSSLQKHTPISKSNSSIKNTKLTPNPFAIQRGISKKKQNELKKLKEAVKEEKGLTKRTLKDFLTLV